MTAAIQIHCTKEYLGYITSEKKSLLDKSWVGLILYFDKCSVSLRVCLSQSGILANFAVTT